ncbi:uroporphyrinogen-III C-methyltransferase [Lysinibacillus sp. fkY74-1]|uniref:Uroporphyrinogen-III C-methyltransferase n=2 Tax=Lysinibacillus TaxID=400634 RepID=W7S3T1_LYSSH|nr:MULTISPECIES: uroporphyrinogen-III C-methyltransferase [Lysinibacillus]MBE5084105.1 uroporphyrinogen-III C-methyltransferase [Bacillus thuringiensis]AMO33126.1 uroporphyrin-III methyltransferase [Lysinibacillus sphaericus]AMR91770.1 uroporphyrin-III methyltransferase [Lysinibacillus sphaericus]ANA45818.1 uroporphyrin-III methyltransferase [Lysinibacillus sphaericus]EWH30933.1 uroporphyrin-III C-methyltransferase [Lysinibacillus sphaericus CBAM5]
MKDGIVYIVGAGPGDPKLITVYGLECIQKADIIAYDRLVNPALLDFAKKDAELVYCGKLPGKHHLIQDEINALLVEKAQQGKIVTRLKGGDPFVFGRGAEEAEILKNHGISYEIVPGITAGIAAPAYAGIPVTHRDFATSFALVTGHGREEKGQDFLNWPALATGIDTVAFYMSVGNIAYIARKLIENGRKATTPVAVIEWGTTAQQRTITGQLDEIANIIEREGYHNPSMIVVGDVVNVREKIQWFEEQGLAFS